MVDSARRSADAMITDFEARFRKLQSEGKTPGDEELKRLLAELEPK